VFGPRGGGSSEAYTAFVPLYVAQRFSFFHLDVLCCGFVCLRRQVSFRFFSFCHLFSPFSFPLDVSEPFPRAFIFLPACLKFFPMYFPLAFSPQAVQIFFFLFWIFVGFLVPFLLYDRDPCFPRGCITPQSFLAEGGSFFSYAHTSLISLFGK